jgi:mRNA interferase MazF
VIERGDVWWLDLPEPYGSGPGVHRPCVIVQSDLFNDDLNTSLAVVLTSNTRLADMPGNVLLSSRVTGLPKDSVANVTQLVTVDHSQLRQHVGRLPPGKMRSIEAGLRLVLDL